MKNAENHLIPVAIQPSPEHQSMYQAVFRPKEQGRHRVTVFLNERKVTESMILRVFNISQCVSVSGQGLRTAQVDRKSQFALKLDRNLAKELVVVVIGEVWFSESKFRRFLTSSK